MRARALLAVVVALVALWAPPASASCDSMLDDAVRACPCLVCPLFFVPAICCATAADSPDFWRCACGGCIVYDLIGIGDDSNAASAPAAPPAATRSTSNAMPY
jgi:hypothetical protein